MAVYQDMQAAGVEPYHATYTALIDAQARNGDMPQACALLRKMEKDGCAPDTITYSSLVKGHCVCGDLAAALKVFQQMVAMGLKAARSCCPEVACSAVG